MKIIVTKDYEEMSKTAADIIVEEVERNKQAVLGLATGSTPMGMYEKLIEYNRDGRVDFSQVSTFNLDEYLGLEASHPQSYRYFMTENFFRKTNIDLDNTHIPNGVAKNPEDYCREYDEMISEIGGIDLQVLGIGTNGHIAFNEPDEELSVGTSIVDLTENTIKDNSRFFDSIEEVPKQAITMGIGSILRAKKIILLANGRSKSEVIDKLKNTKKVSTKLPASFLLLHKDVTVIVDEEANSL